MWNQSGWLSGECMRWNGGGLRGGENELLCGSRTEAIMFFLPGSIVVDMTDKMCWEQELQSCLEPTKTENINDKINKRYLALNLRHRLSRFLSCAPSSSSTHPYHTGHRAPPSSQRLDSQERGQRRRRRRIVGRGGRVVQVTQQNE